LPTMASLQDADVPPIQDEEAGAMGLMEVDPSPVEETPIEYKEKSYFPDQTQGESWGPGAGGVNRTGTLGLGLGDHGVVWWCKSTSPYNASYRKSQTLTWHSNKNPKILLLRLHGLYSLPHHKRRHHPALHPLGRRGKPLPPTHTPILPVPPHRAAPCGTPSRRTRSLWGCITVVSSSPSPASLWR
jgi:hypothetical protein